MKERIKKLIQKPLFVVILSIVLYFITTNTVGGLFLSALGGSANAPLAIILILIAGISLISYIILGLSIFVLTVKQVRDTRKISIKSGFLLLWSLCMFAIFIYIIDRTYIEPRIQDDIHKKDMMEAYIFKQQLMKEFETPVIIMNVSEAVAPGPYDVYTKNGTIIFTINSGREIVNPKIYWDCDVPLEKKLEYAKTLIGKTVQLDVNNVLSDQLLNPMSNDNIKDNMLPIPVLMSINNQQINCDSVK